MFCSCRWPCRLKGPHAHSTEAIHVADENEGVGLQSLFPYRDSRVLSEPSCHGHCSSALSGPELAGSSLAAAVVPQ